MKEYTLDGVDGNAFSLMSYTAKAMKECGFKKQDIELMQTLAMSTTYAHLVNICNEYIEKCNEIIKRES